MMPENEKNATEPQIDNPLGMEGAEEALAQGQTDQAARAVMLEAEVAQLKDQLLRALAEQDNMQRRLIKERDDAGKFAVGKFAKELLSVADNLSRAMDGVTEADFGDNAKLKNLFVGIEATSRQLMNSFEKMQIKPIPALGQTFDPNFHQVVFEDEKSDAPAGTITQELQKGYVIHDRLLREAMVGVSKKKASGAAPDQKVNQSV